MLKKISVVGIICLIAVLFANPSSAAWINGATVTEVGSINGSVRLTVQKGTQVLQKYVQPTYQNEILATALSAMSMNSLVNVYHDSVSNLITIVIITNN